MNGAEQRLIPACLVAFSLHGIILGWQVDQSQRILPKAMAVQRIYVSLTSGRTSRRPAQKPAPQQKEAKKKEVVPPTPPKPQPRPKPQPKPKAKLPAKAPKPLSVASHVKKPITRPQPQPKQAVATEPVTAVPRKLPQTTIAPPLLNAAVGKTSTKADAAQKVRHASPLYQINPPPQYPRLARRREMEGLVLLEVLVDIHGRAKELKIFKSSGYSVLDKAALKAVRRWKFRSGTVAGTAKEMWVKIPIRFNLQGT